VQRLEQRRPGQPSFFPVVVSDGILFAPYFSCYFSRYLMTNMNGDHDSNVKCIVIGCMDCRLNRHHIHNTQVYMIANAGGSIPKHRYTVDLTKIDLLRHWRVAANLCGAIRRGDFSEVREFFRYVRHTELSISLFMQMITEQKKQQIVALATHFDCGAVKTIWAAGNRPPHKRNSIGHAFMREQGDLMRLVKENAELQEKQWGEALAKEEVINIYTRAKVLENYNRLVSYPSVRKAIAAAKDIKFVCYIEIPEGDKVFLKIYDPSAGRFRLTDITLKAFEEKPEMLEEYAINRPVDVRAFVAQNFREVWQDKSTMSRRFSMFHPRMTEALRSLPGVEAD
jgi:carbonic anhydrase